jgi:sugar phosphate isomerase/epimerase
MFGNKGIEMKTGLCSITFRPLNVQQVADLVKRAGLDAIEWGSDVHVKPGDTASAESAKQITEATGLEVSSYGSYYNILDGEGHRGDFMPVLDSAQALGTDTIRIWAGVHPSEVVAADYRAKLLDGLREDLDAAAARNIRLALEFHCNTLTDSNAAALALLNELSHPNLYCYWQPMYWIADADYRFQGLEALKERVINLHVFHWLYHPYNGSWNDNVERCALTDGAADWQRYLTVDLPTGDHYALMEFVRNDSEEAFVKDAATLKSWIK